jgi:hypothetical protein
MNPCNCFSHFSPRAADACEECDRVEILSFGRFSLVHFPQHLTQHSEPNHGVAFGQTQAAHQAADSFIGVGHAAPVQKSAGLKRFQQKSGDALEFFRRG